MTDKQYKCLNGDLIEVGKEYKTTGGSRVLVKYIADFESKDIEKILTLDVIKFFQ